MKPGPGFHFRLPAVFSGILLCWVWAPFAISLLMLGVAELQRPLFEKALGDVPGFVAPKLHRPLPFLPNPVFDAWDAPLYRNLTVHYDSPAWPPLYPFLLRAVQALLPDSVDRFLSAAQLVNFFCMFGIAWILPVYLRESGPGALAGTDPEVVRSGLERNLAILLFLFFFPGHNVFFAAYTETLFLLFSLFALVYYKRGGFALAGAASVLATMTRYQGLFLALALTVAFLFEHGISVARTKDGRRNLVLLSAGWMVFVLWIPVATLWTGVNPFEALAPWSVSLAKEHIPAGREPHLWVLQYLFWNGPLMDRIWFALVIVFLLVFWKRKEFPEMLYLALFLLSLGVHVYRPFAFTRYVSVLAPVYLAIDRWSGPRPLVRLLLLPALVAYSVHTQLLLFTRLIGEP